jgi:hypothetical protein
VQYIDEKRAVEQVCEWLTARFPDIALATVRLEVEQAHNRFEVVPCAFTCRSWWSAQLGIRLVTMSVSAVNTVASS